MLRRGPSCACDLRVELDIQDDSVGGGMQEETVHGSRSAVDDEYFKSYEDIGTHEVCLPALASPHPELFGRIYMLCVTQVSLALLCVSS